MKAFSTHTHTRDGRYARAYVFVQEKKEIIEGEFEGGSDEKERGDFGISFFFLLLFPLLFLASWEKSVFKG